MSGLQGQNVVTSAKIPLVICGVSLNLEQKHILLQGKALFIENMVSKKGTLFSANVQYKTNKQCIEFLFRRNLKVAGDNK